MKKALAILMAIAMIVPAVFATGPAPEVTFGLSASAEVQMIKENTTDTFESSGDASKPAASFNPMGLKATKLVSNDWVNFDWAPMSIKAEGKYDAFRANGDDWSWLKVTATWKDLFGFKIDYEYVQDNKEDGTTYFDNTKTLSKNNNNNISATYDKDGVKFWTKYNANDILDMASVTVAGQADSFLNDFKEIGFEYTNDEVATKLVYSNVPAAYGAKIDTATVEAKNLFGFWTVLLNNADEIGYRLSLGSDSKVEPPQFKIAKDNKIQDPAKAAMNAKNTMKFGENLTVKATLVVPNADVTFTDWLKGDNALVGAEFVLADVGTIGAGAKISQDYVANPAGTSSGPTKLLALLADADATNNANVVKGSAFWVDAKLDKLLGEDKAVYVGVDAQFGYYNKLADTTKFATDNPTKVAEVQVGNTTVIDLYGETKMKLSDMISFSAGALFSLGTGYDVKAVSGAAWEDPTAAQKDANFYTNYTEANLLNGVYGITPFELKAQVDVKINDTVSVYAKENFKANDGDISSKPAIAGAKGMKGFYQKNVLGLGAKLKATEKSTLEVSTDINMFLGLPASSDLYLPNETDANKKIIDSKVAAWKSANFNPFALKVAYSYAY